MGNMKYGQSPESNCLEGIFGLTGCLLLSQVPSEIIGEKMEPERLYDSVNSKNGGLAAWESVRAHKWLEVLNPSELFEEIVVNHEHVECTASAIEALVCFMKLYPGHRKKEIEYFMAKAIRYLNEKQMPDS